MKRYAFIALVIALAWCGRDGVRAFAMAHYGRGENGAALPDPAVTPGAVLVVDLKTLCAEGYTKTVRDVTDETKRQVYASYGAQPRAGWCCEVDHLIPLEIGGSNDIRNLWPQPYLPKPGAHEKDKIENYLHAQVCANQMTIEAAQQAIRTDWTKIRVH